MVKKKEKKNFFEQVSAEVVKETKDFVGEKVKKRIIRYGEISILVLLSFFLISIGIANILANAFPVLLGGYSYLLLGIIFLLISWTLKI